jgi:hypothetical protein
MLYIDTPANVVRLSTAARRAPGDSASARLEERAERARLYYDLIHIHPSPTLYAKGARFMTEISGIYFGAHEAEHLLMLYPQSRTLMVIAREHDENSQIDAEEALAFATGHFFLGSRWVRTTDNVPYQAFIDLLQQQAERLGFNAVRRQPRRTFLVGRRRQPEPAAVREAPRHAQRQLLRMQ